MPENLFMAAAGNIPAGATAPGLMPSAHQKDVPPQVISDSVTALFIETQAATARAHEQFLTFSSRNTRAMAEQLAAIANAGPIAAPVPWPPLEWIPLFPGRLPRIQCLLGHPKCSWTAINALNLPWERPVMSWGTILKLLTPIRSGSRLPDEPLMLVDRIVSVEGEKLSLTRGKVVTQHDVHENAWYLDGGKTPVSISIEAGQADLFLCSWLGIRPRGQGQAKIPAA